MKSKRFLLLCSFSLCLALSAVAQSDSTVVEQAIPVTTPAQQDTVESQLIKDSLQVGDSTVQQLFALRNVYLDSVTSIRSNPNMLPAEQDAALDMMEDRINDQYRDILGDDRFEHYVQMIRTRMDRHNNTRDMNPLADMEPDQ